MHLPATGLAGTEIEFDTQAFEQANYGAASFRVEGVVIASDEEGCAHCRYQSETETATQKANDIR
jgi:hypothetical protein